jgi:hypothetical protein
MGIGKRNIFQNHLASRLPRLEMAIRDPIRLLSGLDERSQRRK